MILNYPMAIPQLHIMVAAASSSSRRSWRTVNYVKNIK